MENIEENVVTKGAAKADPMPSSGIPVEDLGGPTPENYKPDDDSAKLKDPASTLAQVKDVVNAKAMKAEEAETEEEVIEEEEATTDEVVAEEEAVSEEESEEVVAEAEETEEEIIEEEEEKLTSKQMFKHFLKVKNFPKSSKTKQEQFLKVQSDLRLQKSKKNYKSLMQLHSLKS